MSVQIWLAFITASAVLLLIPGPTVLLVVGDTLTNRRRAWSTVLGVGLGDAVAMGLSLAGAGALLRASATAFATMKLLGGLYLLYLGVRSVLGARNGGGVASNTPATAPSCSALNRFSKAWTVTVLNPKSILFFVAFVPQFISQKAAFAPQAALLMSTFVMLSMLNASLYASLAGLLGERLASPAAQRRINCAGGGALITAGTLTLAFKHR